MNLKKLFQLFAEEAEATGVEETAAAEQSTEANEEVVPSVDEEFEGLIKGKFKDAYGARVENTVKGRLKSKNEEIESLNNYKLSVLPLLEHLADTYGLDPDDIEGLTNASKNDRAYISEKALEAGVEPDEILKGNRDKRNQAAMQKQLDDINRQKSYETWFNSKLQEADEFKKERPDFDFEKESQNETFRKLVTAGIPIKQAYFATNEESVRQEIASEVKAKLSTKVNENRPVEAGAGGGAATAYKQDVSSMTGKDILAILKEVERGKRIEL